MASTTIVMCTICNLRHLNVPADVWCPECDEGLCRSCKEHHDLSRLTKGHQTLSVEEYQKLPSLVKKLQQYCIEHNEKYDFLCTKDEILCCRKCVTTMHNKCTHFMAIEDVIVDSKSQTLFQNLEQNLECQLRNLAMAKKDREGNRKLIKEQNDKFHTDIKNIREKINEYLDQLEEKLFEDLDYSTELQTEEIEIVIKEIKSKQNVLEKMKKNLNEMKGSTTNLQRFLGVRKIEKSVTQAEMDVIDLIHSSKFDRINVEMSISNEVSTFLAKIKTLGTVRIVTRPRMISAMSWKEGQGNRSPPMAEPELVRSEISLQLSTKVQAPKGKAGISVTGCAISSCGQIYMADFSPNKRIMTLNSDGTFSKDITFVESSVFDINCIDSTTIAISSGSYRDLKILDLSKQEVTHKTKTSGNCYGVTSADGNLIYCVGNQNIQSFNLSNESTSELSSEKLKNNSYICHSDGLLYHTSKNGSSVSCSDISGNVQWTFQSEQLKNPRGITVDSKGNVFVAGESSNNVIAVFPGGTKFTEVLTKTDGLKKPTAICCDKKNDILVVCTKDGTTFVYKIHQSV